MEVDRMAIEDLAKLVAHKRPDVMLRILRCFYMQDGGLTKDDLMRQTGLNRKILEYYMTRLRYWRILHTRRRRDLPALYFLEPHAFHARIDTLLCDPLTCLIKHDLIALAREREWR